MSVFAWPTAAARTAVPTDAVEPAANAKVSMSFVMADSASAPGLPVAKPAVLRIRFAPMSWNVATRPVRVMSVVKMVVADCVVFVRVGIGFPASSVPASVRELFAPRPAAPIRRFATAMAIAATSSAMARSAVPTVAGASVAFVTQGRCA